VAEQQACAPPSDELAGIGERGLAAREVRPRARGERNRGIQEGAAPGDDLRAARRIIAGPAGAPGIASVP